MNKRWMFAGLSIIIFSGLCFLFGTTPRLVHKKMQDRGGGVGKLCTSYEQAKEVDNITNTTKFRNKLVDITNQKLGKVCFEPGDVILKAYIEKAADYYKPGTTHIVNVDLRFRPCAKTDLLNIRKLKETILHDGPGYDENEETVKMNCTLMDTLDELVQEL